MACSILVAFFFFAETPQSLPLFVRILSKNLPDIVAGLDPFPKRLPWRMI